MQDRHELKENFRLGLCQAAVRLAPASALQIQPVDVDAGGGRRRDLVAHLARDLIGQHDRVQRPLLVLVGARHLLPHGGEEALCKN